MRGDEENSISKHDRLLKILLVLTIGASLLSMGWCWLSWRDTQDGQLAPEAPRQQNLAASSADFNRHGYTLKPLASLQLRARVLSLAWYADDAGAAIAPLDLALGWGPMSDNAVLKHFQISQSQRWYALSAPKSPISMYSAAQHSANMHIIPANPVLTQRLRNLQVGDLIEMRGWLVNVAGDNWHIETSLSRDDRGAGACEVVYVLSLQKINSQQHKE